MEMVTLSRVVLGGRIPAVYDQRYNCHNLRNGGIVLWQPCWQHLACCSINSRHIGSELQFLPTPPAVSTPPLGGFLLEYHHPVWYRKTRMVWLPDGKKFWRYVYSFWDDPRTWQTDRRTDRHRMTAIAVLMHSIVWQKGKIERGIAQETSEKILWRKWKTDGVKCL